MIIMCYDTEVLHFHPLRERIFEGKCDLTNKFKYKSLHTPPISILFIINYLILNHLLLSFNRFSKMLKHEILMTIIHPYFK